MVKQRRMYAVLSNYLEANVFGPSNYKTSLSIALQIFIVKVEQSFPGALSVLPVDIPTEDIGPDWVIYPPVNRSLVRGFG